MPKTQHILIAFTSPFIPAASAESHDLNSWSQFNFIICTYILFLLIFLHPVACFLHPVLLIISKLKRSPKTTSLISFQKQTPQQHCLSDKAVTVSGNRPTRMSVCVDADWMWHLFLRHAVPVLVCVHGAGAQRAQPSLLEWKLQLCTRVDLEGSKCDSWPEELRHTLSEAYTVIRVFFFLSFFFWFLRL